MIKILIDARQNLQLVGESDRVPNLFQRDIEVFGRRSVDFGGRKICGREKQERESLLKRHLSISQIDC